MKPVKDVHIFGYVLSLPAVGVWIETIYYESIRNSKKDLIVNSFQRIVDFQRYTYRKCRNVFINEKELYGGAKRFESDYGMSSSFRRLCKGKLIQEQAIILLRHEHLKYGLMNKIDMLYDEAYELAQRKYNYKTALEKFKKKNGLQNGSECVVRIEKLEMTDSAARYKYYPENSDGSGIVALNRNTGQRILEESLAGYGNIQAAHALRQIEEYQRNGKSQEKDTIVWY